MDKTRAGTGQKQSCHWTKAYFVSGDGRVLNQSLWGSRIFSKRPILKNFSAPPQIVWNLFLARIGVWGWWWGLGCVLGWIGREG